MLTTNQAVGGATNSPGANLLAPSLGLALRANGAYAVVQNCSRQFCGRPQAAPKEWRTGTCAINPSGRATQKAHSSKEWAFFVSLCRSDFQPGRCRLPAFRDMSSSLYVIRGRAVRRTANVHWRFGFVSSLRTARAQNPFGFRRGWQGRLFVHL